MSKEREPQPDTFHTPISQEVINKTLEDIPLALRLQADVKIQDLLNSSDDDRIATWLTFYSAAMAGSIHSSDPIEQSIYSDTFLIGALFMYHTKNNQDLESRKRKRRLNQKDLSAYVEEIFPVEFESRRSEEVLVHNKKLARILKKIKGQDPNKEYMEQISIYKNHPEIIDQSFTQELQGNADEFRLTEKGFAEIFSDPAMRTLSKEKQEAFWTGLICTYYLFRTDEELKNLRALWKKS